MMSVAEGRPHPSLRWTTQPRLLCTWQDIYVEIKRIAPIRGVLNLRAVASHLQRQRKSEEENQSLQDLTILQWIKAQYSRGWIS